MNYKELYKFAVEQIIECYLDDPDPHQISIINVTKYYDKENEYECHLFDDPIVRYDNIEFATDVYVKNLKRNKNGILNVTLKDIELNTKINIKNYYYWIKNLKEPRVNTVISINEYKDLKRCNKFIKHIYDLIKEYNKFDQEVKEIYIDQLTKLFDNYHHSFGKMNELRNKYSNLIKDYDYHDPDFIKEAQKSSRFYGQQLEKFIDIYKSLYYHQYQY